MIYGDSSYRSKEANLMGYYAFFLMMMMMMLILLWRKEGVVFRVDVAGGGLKGLRICEGEVGGVVGFLRRRRGFVGVYGGGVSPKP